MDLRLAILDLARRHQLSAESTARLTALAGFEQQPPQLMRYFPAGIAILGAVLGGLGIIFWIAANWESLSRTGRFALLEGVVIAMCLGALFRPRARVPLGLLALLSTGGLLAFFGITYQTGADPWQLFAWWTVLTLPLCLGVRHDALWTAWAIVAMTFLTLWTRAQGGHGWQADEHTLTMQLLHWLGALALTFALSPQFERFTGAGTWSLRLCLVVMTAIVTFNSLENIIGHMSPGRYFLGLIVLGGAAVAFSLPRLHDTFALSAIGLGLNVLVIGGLARLLFWGDGGEVMSFLMLGLIAAGLLGATVKGIMHLSRRYALAGEAQ
jgi:uncharacterized membrane protein